MGTSNDAIDSLGCSDQRLIFRLVLAEVKRLRKINFAANVELTKGEEGCRERALEILNQDSSVKFAQSVK